MISPSHVSNLPEEPGVYLFHDKKGEIIYVGKAKNLLNRVSSYFQNKNHDLKTSLLVGQIHTIDTVVVLSEFQALLLEAKLIKKHKPKYNLICKDDRNFIYIKITKEEFPAVATSRLESEKKAILYGPFPSKYIIRQILTHLRKIFPYCNQNRKIKKPCFYSHLNLCNPCPSFVKTLDKENFDKNRKIYLKNINQIKRILSGNIRKVKDDLVKEMQNYSKINDFEKASITREKIRNLEYLNESYHSSNIYLSNSGYSKEVYDKEKKELTDYLKKYYDNIYDLKKIECYDISNISGKLAVGSMVVFENSKPYKEGYRKFRIRSLDTPNDFAMLKEVLSRRFNHEEWPMPDLIVIDGGKPQLSYLAKFFESRNIKIPFIGLAKQRETVVIPHNNSYVYQNFDSSSGSLHLLARLRDEAHRFAHSYHENLRLKELKSFVDKKR